MHYDPEFNKGPAFKPKDPLPEGFEIGQANKLSKGDIDRINKLYCPDLEENEA